MLILMKVGATTEDIELVCEIIRKRGIEPLVLPGEPRQAVGIPSSLSQDLRIDLEAAVGALSCVSKITQTSSPFKLASLEFHPQRTLINVGGVEIGAGSMTMISGPCSVEGYEQFSEAARLVKNAGVPVLRGGAFKPRTSPYAFQGLQLEGLKILKAVGEEAGLVTITEVMSADLVSTVADYADILQIGARSMQNYPLLIEAAKSGKPIFLKRAPSATIDEFLLASEYVLNQGNPHVILCERGIVPLDRTYARNTLDLGAVPVLKELTHLPVVVDPSHGTGRAQLVGSMALAAVAAGADGLMVEMHPHPQEALSDGGQALTPAQFEDLTGKVRSLTEFLGVRFSGRMANV